MPTTSPHPNPPPAGEGANPGPAPRPPPTGEGWGGGGRPPATVVLGDSPLTHHALAAVARDGARLDISAAAWARIANAQAIVQRIVASGDSGLQPQVVAGLLALLNLHITPCVPAQGSVGYLTHMAHIGVALLGVGDVRWQGRTLPAAEALAANGLQPLVLGAKDGLCLVNGTPCMTGLAALALHQSLDNLTQILAIEYLLAAQALEFLKDQRFGEGTGRAWALLRQRVPPFDADRFLAPDMAQAAALLRTPFA